MLSLTRSVAARLAACLAACALALAAAAPATLASPASHASHRASRDAAGAATAQDDTALSLAAAAAPAGSCSYQQIVGGYEWVCNNVTTIPGTQPGGHSGGGGGGPQPVCTLTPLSQQQAQYLGLQWPAPAGHTWETITCAGTQPFGGVVLVGGTTAAPVVPPSQLIQLAIAKLQLGFSVKADPPGPPAGKGGLVGLPEWFWVSSGWGALPPQKAAAGPAWVIATATPEKIIFSPGGGLAPITCAGPGTPYNPALPLGQQHTDCFYTYNQPSTGQPENAYQATVSVVWHISWIGSDNSHNDFDKQWSEPLTLPVAAGQALVTGR
jgi:hypothetical protein